jgi:hypothetical protein
MLSQLAALARLPGPDTVDGMTLGHAIFLRRGCEATPALLAHECRHVQQVEAAGSLGVFMARYLRQIAHDGYRDAAFEVDAREAAARAMKNLACH